MRKIITLAIITSFLFTNSAYSLNLRLPLGEIEQKRGEEARSIFTTEPTAREAQLKIQELLIDLKYKNKGNRYKIAMALLRDFNWRPETEEEKKVYSIVGVRKEIDLLTKPDSWRSWQWHAERDTYYKQAAERLVSKGIKNLPSGVEENLINRMIADHDPDERKDAYNALKTLGIFPPQKILAKKYKLDLSERASIPDNTVYIHSDAARGLGKLDPRIKEVIPALITALGDESKRVCEEAVNSFEKHGKEASKAVPIILKELKSNRGRLRWAYALRALGKIGKPSEVEDFIREVLLYTDFELSREIKQSAAMALGDLGEISKESVGALEKSIEYIGDGGAGGLRTASLDALEQLGFKTPDLVMKKFLADLKQFNNPYSRVDFEAIQELGPEAKGIAPHLVKLLARKDVSISRYPKILETIGATESPRIFEKLINFDCREKNPNPYAPAPMREPMHSDFYYALLEKARAIGGIARANPSKIRLAIKYLSKQIDKRPDMALAGFAEIGPPAAHKGIPLALKIIKEEAKIPGPFLLGSPALNRAYARMYNEFETTIEALVKFGDKGDKVKTCLMDLLDHTIASDFAIEALYQLGFGQDPELLALSRKRNSLGTEIRRIRGKLRTEGVINRQTRSNS